MISDSTVLSELQLAWEGVRDDRNVIVGNLNVATMAGRPATSAFRDLCFNLLLARALSVIEDCLEQLRLEGHFSSGSRRMKDMMESSRTSLRWQDYQTIDRARDRRNASIHDRVRLPHGECRDYLAAIERELHGWQVIRDVRSELWHW